MNSSVDFLISNSTVTRYDAAPEDSQYIAAWNYRSGWLDPVVPWEPQEREHEQSAHLTQKLLTTVSSYWCPEREVALM